MIKFNPNKSKKMNMTLEAVGVDNKKINFEFIIEIQNIKYSFPVRSNGLRLNIDVPKLSEIIKDIIPNGEYKALIEAKIATENLKGYYVRPWEENILIESDPEINVKLSEDLDEKEEIILTVSKPVIVEENSEEKKIDEYIEEKKIEEKKENSKFKNIFK